MNEIIRIKTITDVHDFFGFNKPKHPLVSLLPIDEKMTDYDYGNFSYTFDFYQISLKEGRSGSLRYGRNSYDFQEGTMTFIQPNQVIRVEKGDQTGGAGWTLLFHPDLIRKSELNRTIEDHTFFDYEANEALHLSEEEKVALTDLAKKIEKEYQQNIDKHSQDIIIANIDMMLKYCKRYYDRQFFTRSNLNKDLMTQLSEVIRQYYATNRAEELGVLSVSYCAKKLNLSPNYLGDLLKSETGKSAREHLQDYLIEKAKTQLIGSNDTVREIAYSLGFEYPQSFNKVFRAKLGMTPSEYRKLN